MALVCIAIFKRQVRQLVITLAIQLLEGRIELGDPPINIWCDTDVLLENSLKCSFGNMQFFLNSDQRFF